MINGNNIYFDVRYYLIFTIPWFLIIVATIVTIASYWFVFKKAGKKPWFAFVPLYCDYLISSIALCQNVLCWYFHLRPLIPYVSLLLFCEFIAMEIESYLTSYGICFFCICLILTLLACIDLSLSVILHLYLAKKFGKGKIFGIGLTLLPFIFYPILAFGKTEYNNPTSKNKSDIDIIK